MRSWKKSKNSMFFANKYPKCLSKFFIRITQKTNEKNALSSTLENRTYCSLLHEKIHPAHVNNERDVYRGMIVFSNKNPIAVK